jgi:hypothetical protein
MNGNDEAAHPFHDIRYETRGGGCLEQRQVASPSLVLTAAVNPKLRFVLALLAVPWGGRSKTLQVTWVIEEGWRSIATGDVTRVRELRCGVNRRDTESVQAITVAPTLTRARKKLRLDNTTACTKTNRPSSVSLI